MLVTQLQASAHS